MLLAIGKRLFVVSIIHNTVIYCAGRCRFFGVERIVINTYRPSDH